MLPELGQIALILALLLALLLGTIPLVGAHRQHGAWMQTARPLVYGQLVFIVIAYAVLTHAFVVHDFSVAYVAANSNSLLPTMYQFPAVWGAHEGSLLLWVLILGLWTAAVAVFSKPLPQPVVARVLAVMGWISVGFLSFLIFTSDPFARLLPAPQEGGDLNPLLQDPGMIFHPPLLYTGYVGFAVAFAFAIAALIDGNVNIQWIRWARPWTNVAWAFLTIGIALGSFWAYYELGWGGWWFWDPVENASFMPWLVGLALIHSQAVTEKRGSFRAWTLLLAIAAFSLSLLGTFLVRSGVLTSVHAFASDPMRGLFILTFLAIVIGGSLLLFALRAPDEDKGQPFVAASRETLLLANNLLLTAAAFMILLGTLYPLLAEALNLGKISVGSPYFGLLFTLLMTPLVLLVPFGPLTRWQREQPDKPLRLLAPWALLALAGGVVAFFAWPSGTVKTAAACVAALWLTLGTLRFVRERFAKANGRFTAEMIGMCLAHVGLAVFFFGVMITESTSLEKDVAAKPGQHFALRGYDFRFDGVERVQGPNYEADRGTIVVTRGDQVIATLKPEKRAYASGGSIMTETAIDSGLRRDIYIAMGDSLGPDGSWALRLHVKPFIRWIWLGALMMALGGFTVVFDKRFRRPVVAGSSDMIRRLLPLAAFIVLAALLYAGVRMNSGKDTSVIPSPLIGKATPKFSLPVFGDPSRKLGNADLLGKPYLLNVWGSWCENCREEHPQITALAKSGKVLVIGYDYKDAPEDARQWLQKYGDPYSLIIADEDGHAALDWGIYGAPETFLVDAHGVIRWKLVGGITDEVIREQIEPELAKLAASP